MKKTLILLSLAVLSTGCVTPTRTFWEKPDARQSEFVVDRYECVQQSRTSWSGGGAGLVGLAIMANAQKQAQDQARKLFTLCMEARGYTGRQLAEHEAVPVRQP